MINRTDYHLLMQVLFDSAAAAKGLDEFGEILERLIITSYEINNPEHGSVVAIDVTADLIEVMGRHWAAIQAIGIQKVELVQYKLDDVVILETGRMEGYGAKELALDTIRTQPDEVLKAFTKALVLAMRKHDSMILKEMTEEGDTKHHMRGDVLDLAQLVQEFLEEEVDETVAKFSSQLDAVFGVAAAVSPDWSAPRGEVKHDDLPPPG